MKEFIVGAARWIIDYLEIPNYLSLKARRIFEGEKTYNSEEHYWNDILGPIFHKRKLRNPVIREGDVVVLRNFQLSPWSPRLPGLYWTLAGKAIRQKTVQRLRHSKGLGLHYDPYDKKKRMVRGGMGTVRLANHEHLRLYGATTSGKIDAAIPVVVSSNVSKNLLRFSKKIPLMEVDLRGAVRMIPLTYQPGRLSPHIPKLCLYVNSILNVKKYISDFALKASGWTIYYNPKSEKSEKSYGFTYCHFNPIDEGEAVEATNWMHNYIDEYTKGDGIAITDYDELVPRFQSAVLPLTNVMDGNIDYEAISSIFGGVDFRQQYPLSSRFYR